MSTMLSDTPSLDRPDQAPVQVVCLGLSRTGTSSLSSALDILGFGPCYHTFTILRRGRDDWHTWFKFSDGVGTFEDLDILFNGYRSVLDQPPAHFPAAIYAAYPNAKFILTTRDPGKWERSMQSTILPAIAVLNNKKNRSPLEDSMWTWHNVHMLARYHRLLSNAQQEIIDHNENVQRIIPENKLLVYEVEEGWERLVDFLGVPMPDVPFPHLNDTAKFKESVDTRDERETPLAGMQS
ncbi:hypothetical protein K439DRAFT_1659818 [Ramaria rubella]|nr:hypothetical protein K439DRAFT_1659818 [Ramaria rubella]